MGSEAPVQLAVSEPDESRFAWLYPLLWAAFLTIVVAGPWLTAGYLFGTDWPGPRRFDFPTTVSSSAPIEAALAACSLVVSSDLVGKVMFFGLLFVAGLTSFGAVPVNGFVPRAAASTLYTINPFVYGRLHYGQLFLLAAYALLPWFVMTFRDLLIKPNVRLALIGAVAIGLIGMFSPHVFLIAAFVAAVLLVAHVVFSVRSRETSARTAVYVLILALGAALITSYWALPLIRGQGNEGALIAATGSAQLYDFAARPDNQLGLLPNLLGLYGFWAEDINRFTNMKAFVPGWPIVLVALLAVAAIGVIDVLKRRSSGMVPWVTGLLIAAGVGVILEMGVSQPQTAGLVTWLDAHLALYRGMRDAGKWAVLIALVYSQLFGLGVAAILDWARRSFRNPPSGEWVAAGAAALLLALPLYYGNGLLFGAHGEIQPSAYPAGWYEADHLLAADNSGARTLFLPWHEYMSYTFIRNQNKVVATPAPTFFTTRVLASQDPEVPGIAPPMSADQVAIRALVSQGSRGDWARQLESMNVKYVVLAKQFDWQSYAYLDSQANLTKVADFGSIVVFRNNLFR